MGKLCHSKLVVLTGGPGAGKTAVLELARRELCHHVAVLPEAASIVFGGGFWRLPDLPSRKAAQRAIFHVQRELESMAMSQPGLELILCDRGTLDGLAYWPGTEDSFWKETGSIQREELARYAAVIHLRTPPLEQGYNHQNPIRIESASEAMDIDSRMERIWRDHPRREIVNSSADFMEKAIQCLRLILREAPSCCRR